MALSLPVNFEQDIQGRDTNLVPVVVIGNYRADHGANIFAMSDYAIMLGVGVTPITDQHGSNKLTTLPLLLNVPSLKESVDIEKRNYKIPSVTLSISNYKYNGERFSELFGDNSLINTECRIFWVSPSANVPWFFDIDPTGIDSYNDLALQIYNGTIRRYEHDNEKVKIVVEDR